MTSTLESANAILAHVGGAANVAALQHCSTRLRFSLVDDTKADDQALAQIPGVIGVVGGVQTQVIMGSNIAGYYSAIEKLREGKPAATRGPEEAGTRRRLTPKRVGFAVMDFVVSVFTPIIPAIAGAGILKSLLILGTAMGWLQAASSDYKVLSAIPDAVFFFLPLLVAYTAAKKLSVNIPVALGIVGLLLFPAFTALASQQGGVALFGLPVPSIAYNAQVFPPILAVLLLFVVEPLITRITPGPIRTFFVPLASFLVVSPAMIFLLGPLGFWLGSAVTAGMLWLHGTLGWIAIALLAAALPFFVSIGMHKAFLPPTIAAVAANGKDSFYLIASLAHNIAESGSSFAVAIRTKNKTLRSTAFAAGISALFGITEPSLYGVTLQNRRPLVAVIAGSFVGGAYLGLTVVSAFAVVSPGAASISMFIDAANPWNFINALIGLAISFAVSFVVSLSLWKDSKSATLRVLEHETAGETALSANAAYELHAPMSGEVIPLDQVDDAVFSARILGNGVAIRPTDGKVVAPVSGTVSSFLDSRHAIGIKGDDGIEVLVHVGLDTVHLEGNPFVAHIAQGDHVEAGQLLVEADLQAIRDAGYDTTTPVVVLNSRKYDVDAGATGAFAAGSVLMAARVKEVSNESA